MLVQNLVGFRTLFLWVGGGRSGTEITRFYKTNGHCNDGYLLSIGPSIESSVFYPQQVNSGFFCDFYFVLGGPYLDSPRYMTE